MKKGRNYMRTAELLCNEEMAAADAMEQFVRQLRKRIKKDPEQARREAREALIRTGVATNKGNLKKKIVSWE